MHLTVKKGSHASRRSQLASAAGHVRCRPKWMVGATGAEPV